MRGAKRARTRVRREAQKRAAPRAQATWGGGTKSLYEAMVVGAVAIDDRCSFKGKKNKSGATPPI